MKDENDNQTLDLAMTIELAGSPAKASKPGRPGRQVTRKNFFSLRHYFDRKYRYRDYTETSGAAYDFQMLGFPDQEITQKRIDAQTKFFKELLATPGTGYTEYNQQQLDQWSKQKPVSLEDEMIARFQAWVNQYITPDEWKRIGNVLRQKKHKSGHGDYKERVMQIPVTTGTHRELEKLRKEMGGRDNWDEVLSSMVHLTREAIKTRDVKRKSAEQRKRTMARNKF